MKKVIKIILIILWLISLSISLTLNVIEIFVLLGFTLYKLIKSNNKRLYISAILYILNLLAYYGLYLQEASFDTYFQNEIGQSIGFSVLAIIATIILFKNINKISSNEKNKITQKLYR